jgi:DNA repair photolyase
MGKMFTYNGKTMKTWNVFSGCSFQCTYCWAKSLIETRMKDTPKYKECLFAPTFHQKEMAKTFKPNDFVFVAPMGDMAFCSYDNTEKILAKVREYSQTKFLFCTKNPGIYQKYPDLDNVYYGATIETNRPYASSISKAPQPFVRYAIMGSLENVKKFISIEPIMDFDLLEFIKWIADIKPDIVEIGADNYRHNLPEPSGIKVKNLIEAMESNGIEVVRKEGLERLLK